MPRPHSTMRKTRDVLRLHFSEGLSLRQTASSLSMPFTTVADLAKRAKAAGLSWPLEDIDDDTLDRRLFQPDPATPPTHPQPDFASMERELRHKGVTRQLLWLE